MGAGAAHGPQPLTAARIEVWKAKRELRLYSEEKLVKRYRIGLGLSPVGQKERAGDRRTPEGSYRICLKNLHSQYYLSLQISYPNRTDADLALVAGRLAPDQYERIAAADRRGALPPSNTSLGGDVFIHGGGSSADWTWGCVALDDPDMKELFALVPVGTPVEIRP
jgi:murein L,D-transpeptidase YafK